MAMLRERRQAAFEGAVRVHAGELYRYAFWLCRNRWRAEDLVQETLTRAWRGWEGLREPRVLKSWLFTILYREFAREVAGRQPARVAPEEQPGPFTDHDPALALDLDRALARLGEESRQALLLQVLGGFSCEEIARVLGSTQGAVMTRLSRARQAMRRALEPADYEREAKEG
jgi:RNA polymerase sigma-70 factor (ECF subfamily)